MESEDAISPSSHNVTIDCGEIVAGLRSFCDIVHQGAVEELVEVRGIDGPGGTPGMICMPAVPSTGCL